MSNRLSWFLRWRHDLKPPVPQTALEQVAAFETAHTGLREAFEAVRERADERDRLVGICVDLADRLREREPGLWARFRDGLEEVGVALTIVDGEPFDPARHRAVGKEPTDDPESHLTVALTQLCGVRDRGRHLRTPEVVVYRKAETGDVG